MNGHPSADVPDRQPDLLVRLKNVVRQLGSRDIRTVSALIAKVIGDQNAGSMAIRLLYWFPHARKESGWVYKSWRDWNAECNLSQAQVKRVHSKGLLETIGIERVIMKANGTPTVHYRLDENRLIQRLAEFLETSFLQIKVWMCPEPPNEGGQEHPSKAAKSDQLNLPKQPDECGEDELMNSAETAKSITDSNLHTKQQDNHQDRQHNSFSVAVDIVEIENDKAEILQSLQDFGISALRAASLMQRYGNKRIDEVIKHTKTQKCTNSAGYLIRALRENWMLGSKYEKEDYACGNGMAYVTGKYAAFINH